MNRVASKYRCLATSNPLFSTIRFNSQLFVSRLSFYTSDDELKALFSPFGDVKEVKLAMDRRTGRAKGFGFVTFKAEADAQNALKAMNYRMVRGRLILVEFVKNSETDTQQD